LRQCRLEGKGLIVPRIPGRRLGWRPPTAGAGEL